MLSHERSSIMGGGYTISEKHIAQLDMSIYLHNIITTVSLASD